MFPARKDAMYPYEPGQYGINPRVLSEVIRDRVTISTTSESGRVLSLTAGIIPSSEGYTTCYFGIRDAVDKQLKLVAWCLGNPHRIMKADVRNRIQLLGDSPRHPDLFPTRFLRMAIPFLDSTQPTDSFVDIWNPNTTNYQQYWLARTRGADSLEASKETWTAGVVGEFGYLFVLDEEIIEATKPNGENFVLVRFFKEKNPHNYTPLKGYLSRSTNYN